MIQELEKSQDHKLQQVIKEKNDAELRINELEAQLQDYQTRGTVRQLKDLVRHIARTLRSVLRKALEQKPPILMPYNDESLHYSETDSVEKLLQLARQSDRTNFMLSKPHFNTIRRLLRRILGLSYRWTRDSLKTLYKALRPRTGENS